MEYSFCACVVAGFVFSSPYGNIPGDGIEFMEWKIGSVPVDYSRWLLWCYIWILVLFQTLYHLFSGVKPYSCCPDGAICLYCM